MRLIKMFGLAAVAALAVAAYVGASTASADWLCEENISHTSECPAGKRVEKNAKIVGLATNKSALLLNGAKIEMKCDSKTLGKFLGNESVAGTHKPVLGLIETLTFTNCEGPCSEAVGDNLPFLLLGVAAQLHALISEDGKGAPAAELRGCPFGATCLYKIENPPALLKVEGDTLVANKVPLLSNGTGACFLFPELATWDATYLLTLDVNNEHKTPIYLTLLPASLP